MVHLEKPETFIAKLVYGIFGKDKGYEIYSQTHTPPLLVPDWCGGNMVEKN